MEVCYFCWTRRPVWTVNFQTSKMMAAVDMCEECYNSFRDQEAAVRRLYGSRRFWLKMLLAHCLAWVGLRFAPFGRLAVRTEFVRRRLAPGPRTPAWFALRVGEALRGR